MKKPFNLIFLLLILILFTLSGIYAYSTSLKYVTADMSLIVLMAKHTIEKGEHHYFFYGQHYNGGSAISSYLLVPFVNIFGVSSLPLNILSLLIALVFFVICYFITMQIFSKRVSNLTVLFLLFSANIFFYNMFVATPYIISLIFNVVVLYLFYKSVLSNNKIIYVIAFGVTAAIAHWVLEFIFPLLITILFFWFIIDKFFFVRKIFWIFVLSFTIGEMPLIIYNITHNFANIKQLLAGTFIHRFVCEHNILPATVDFGGRMVNHCKVFTETRIPAPISSVFESLHSFFGSGFAGYVYLGIVVSSIVFFVSINFKEFRKIILDLIKFKNSNFQKSKSIELILVIYVVLYLALFILSSFPELNHLLGLYPFIAMILALFFNRLFQLKTKVYKITTIILLILLITSSVASYEFLFTLQPIEDVSEIVDFLEEKNISYLYTTFFIKWRLIMESDEHIIASCDGLCPCVHRYPLYEEIVSKQTKTPIILRDGSLLNDKLKDYLYEHKIIFNTLSIDNKSIYYHFSEEIVPSDFVSNCKFLDGFPPK